MLHSVLQPVRASMVISVGLFTSVIWYHMRWPFTVSTSKLIQRPTISAVQLVPLPWMSTLPHASDAAVLIRLGEVDDHPAGAGGVVRPPARRA